MGSTGVDRRLKRFAVDWNIEKSYKYLEGQQQSLVKMERKISQGRKLSTDMHRKLSAISNCSDVSNLSVMLGMDPNDFKSTIQNILELDIGEDWPESEDESELTEYASEQNPVQIERKNSEVVQITPDQRKSSTGSQVRNVTYL